MEETSLLERLAKIQTQLKVPKSQRNTFGNYNYRNAEDILEAVKPLLGGLALTLSDEPVLIGERYYIKATARLDDDKHAITVTAYAREEETKKGMDGSQITGASSSYARKYALNGMFLIDDTKDSDSTNDHGKIPAKVVDPEPSLTTEQIAELMKLAKMKGYATKELASEFLDAAALGPFTKLPAAQFESFKKMVISTGWKNQDPPMVPFE